MTALLLLALHLAVTAWLALRPLDVLWVSPANLEPFATLREDVAQGPAAVARALFPDMLRLAPLGVLLPLLGRRLDGRRFVSLGRTVGIAAVFSLALEFGQSLVPSRVANVDSVLIDALGVALTHQLCHRRLQRLTCRASCAGRQRSDPPFSGSSGSSGSSDGSSHSPPSTSAFRSASSAAPAELPAPWPTAQARRVAAVPGRALDRGRGEPSVAPVLTGRV